MSLHVASDPSMTWWCMVDPAWTAASRVSTRVQANASLSMATSTSLRVRQCSGALGHEVTVQAQGAAYHRHAESSLLLSCPSSVQDCAARRSAARACPRVKAGASTHGIGMHADMTSPSPCPSSHPIWTCTSGDHVAYLVRLAKHCTQVQKHVTSCPGPVVRPKRRREEGEEEGQVPGGRLCRRLRMWLAASPRAACSSWTTRPGCCSGNTAAHQVLSRSATDSTSSCHLGSQDARGPSCAPHPLCTDMFVCIFLCACQIHVWFGAQRTLRKLSASPVQGILYSCAGTC